MADAAARGSGGGQPSWYLDPLVAAQKRHEHLALLRAWATDAPRVILKTDLFEEAHGADELISAFPAGSTIVGMDVVAATVRRASARRLADARFVVSDVRRLALADASVDLVFSNSTLDHFERAGDLEVAVGELVRVLRPGGRLIVTLDNPRNPLYGVLRWVARRGSARFALGHTLSRDALAALIRREGLEIVGTGLLIHNPRLLSTGLFLALRRTFRRRADRPIARLLDAFGRMARLPTREFTACFVAVCGQKPLGK